jgi:hypothetical protein
MLTGPSSQNMRRIVCLANSRKPDGRCVAGKLYAQGKFGSWLRPISTREGEELSEQERLTSKGLEPALLDILEFTISKHKPSSHQPENFVINPQHKFKQVGRISAQELLKVIDRPTNLWIMGYQSKTFGKNDLVPPTRISEVSNSLYLINPHSFTIQVVQGTYSLQVRGHFTYLGAEYNLRITDPIVEERFTPKGVGEYKIEDVLLTISLAEKLFTVASNPSSSGYYKLIAGVIDISSLGQK